MKDRKTSQSMVVIRCTSHFVLDLIQCRINKIINKIKRLKLLCDVLQIIIYPEKSKYYVIEYNNSIGNVNNKI